MCIPVMRRAGAPLGPGVGQRAEFSLGASGNVPSKVWNPRILREEEGFGVVFLGDGNSCRKGREVECLMSLSVSGLGWASTLEYVEALGEAGEGIIKMKLEGEAFWIRLWILRFYYVCNGQTHRKLLNSGDAPGFWQEALAAGTGWVGVGSSCRWRAPWKRHDPPGKPSGGRGPSPRGGEETALRNITETVLERSESGWIGRIRRRKR